MMLEAALPTAIFDVLQVLRRESLYLWHYISIQFGQIFGYYSLGILIGSLISVFAKGKMLRMHAIMRQNGERPGVSGALPGLIAASLIGVASPLCMYGTVPIAASFSEKGAKDDALAAFMMCSILLNPQLIIYSAALGAAALAVRVVSCFLCGALAGLCVRIAYVNRGKGFFRFDGFAARPADRDTDPNPALRLSKNILRNIKATGVYFIVGIVLSAAFQRYVPETVMVSLFGGSRAFGSLMAATIGVPLYVCGGGTIPLLQGWLAGGMSLGAAAAFMISGPATKITNLGAVKIVLGAKRFALYIAFAIAYATIAGILTNVLI